MIKLMRYLATIEITHPTLGVLCMNEVLVLAESVLAAQDQCKLMKAKVRLLKEIKIKLEVLQPEEYPDQEILDANFKDLPY